MTTAKGKWEFLYKSYAPTTDVSNVTAAVNVNATAANQAAYADELAIYEITNAEYDAIANMTPEQVAVHFPYVDTMTNVKNPYAIVTGGNLLPPFYEWVFLSGSPKIVDPIHWRLALLVIRMQRFPLFLVLPIHLVESGLPVQW